MSAKRKNVAFECLIQQVDTKSLRTGDKSTRVTLEIDSPKDSMLDSLNRLHRADANVFVVIAAKEKEA